MSDTCVVFNNLHDCAVEGVSVCAKHMSVAGYPVVNDANGNPTRPPSSAKSLSGAAGTDWIDAAPNAQFASVGAWSTTKPWISFS